MDILIDNILQYGFKRIILSVGYLKKQVIKHFNDNMPCSLEFSEEETALGTGGAVKKVKPMIKSKSFLVMNGDSICRVDLGRFYRFHIGKKAVVSIVLARPEVSGDYGHITLDASYRITSFREKVRGRKNRLINAGIYLMQKDIFSYMPHKQRFSLEYDFFPQVIKENCYGFLSDSALIDIGTPDGYEKAKQILERNKIG